uniref:Uncharacterized protein n=1 Tax=Arundo donax TaxID=35708 RepID=A0A0A9C0J2_ARUDO
MLQSNRYHLFSDFSRRLPRKIQMAVILLQVHLAKKSLQLPHKTVSLVARTNVRHITTSVWCLSCNCSEISIIRVCSDAAASRTISSSSCTSQNCDSRTAMAGGQSLTDTEPETVTPTVKESIGTLSSRQEQRTRQFMAPRSKDHRAQPPASAFLPAASVHEPWPWTNCGH